jgi:hypothetical protein
MSLITAVDRATLDTALPPLAQCPECLVAQREAGHGTRPVVCSTCGTRWTPDPCEGCAETKLALLAMHNRRAWQRCADCDRIVAISLRALDRAFRGQLRGIATVRRRAMLAELDNLAQWWPTIHPHAKEPSPIVGDGNKGGGAKISATDRPDHVNDEHEDLARAQVTDLKLGALLAAGRFETRLLRMLWILATIARLGDHRAQMPPVTSATERGSAVLEWLTTRCTVAQRKKLAESVGWTFIDRETQTQWLADPSAGREEAKRHGTELLAEAERCWFGNGGGT